MPLGPLPVAPGAERPAKARQRAVGHDHVARPDLGGRAPCPVPHDGAARRPGRGRPGPAGAHAVRLEGRHGLGALPEHGARFLGAGRDEPVEVGPRMT